MKKRENRNQNFMVGGGGGLVWPDKNSMLEFVSYAVSVNMNSTGKYLDSPLRTPVTLLFISRKRDSVRSDSGFGW